MDRTDNNNLVPAAFSYEFLDVFMDTAFDALRKYLEKINADDAAQVLVNDLEFIANHIEEYRKTCGEHPQINQAINETMIESVAGATVDIAEIGGVFHGPSKSSTPRETDISEKTVAQIENIFQRADGMAKKKHPKRKGKNPNDPPHVHR